MTRGNKSKLARYGSFNLVGRKLPAPEAEVIDADDEWHCDNPITPCDWRGPKRDLVPRGDLTACPKCGSFAVFQKEQG